MLDAYIIEKIHRDRERAVQDRRLQIEKRAPPQRSPFHDRHGQRSDDDSPKRGTTVIDFTV